ncbi:MAG: DPP IV N-terminal domain-containing protein [Chloroflexota bacterium]
METWRVFCCRHSVFQIDGKRILFVSDRDGNVEIYVMNADGSNQTRLTNNPARDVYPLWSPDGTRIMFVSNRDGAFEIYVMHTDGSNVIRLTRSGNNLLPDWQ